MGTEIDQHGSDTLSLKQFMAVHPDIPFSKIDAAFKAARQARNEQRIIVTPPVTLEAVISDQNEGSKAEDKVPKRKGPRKGSKTRRGILPSQIKL